MAFVEDRQHDCADVWGVAVPILTRGELVEGTKRRFGDG